MKTRPFLFVFGLVLLGSGAFACDGGGAGGDGDAGDGDGDAGDGDGDAGDGDGDAGDGDGDAGDGDGDAGDGDGDAGDGDGDAGDGDGDAGDGDGDTGDGDTGDGDMDGAGGFGGQLGGGCSSDSECDDSDACTTDRCIESVCENIEPGSLCDSGTCVGAAFASREPVGCLAAFQTLGPLSMCQSSTCSGGGAGCDLDITFGPASAMTSDGGGGTWTTVIEIPIIALSGEIDATLRESNCIATLSVADGEEIPVTVTITTQEQTMCGEGEEIIERTPFAVLTNLVIDVTPGEGTTTECPIMHNGLQGGSPRSAVETEVRRAILGALGDLDSVVPVGATCTQCTGACDGLACD